MVKKEKPKVDHDKERSKRRKDKESGVARGIDFQFVSNVINFDFPQDVDSYIHRVGRTARGNNKGTALSLVAGKELNRLQEVESHLAEQMGMSAEDDDTIFKPYKFKMEELDGFRYRARDAWRAVTKIAIREARLKEIKQEIFNSSKLKSHFEANPKDIQVLRHDRALHTVKQQSHLKAVPDYIVPSALKKVSNLGKRSRGKFGKGQGESLAKKKYEKKKSDPLRALIKK